MATVFLAQDLKHHRSVAIKVLHAELTAALGPERFLREIEIAARLQHPHIVPLYDSGAAAGFFYYVMPYVEGESLRDRLAREKQLPQEDALRIATEVAGALAYAHSHGVVHRDVKPENIMLSGGTAVVTDFGIARAVSAAGAGRHLTETGTIIGTPAYMSPEQSTGPYEIDGGRGLGGARRVLRHPVGARRTRDRGGRARPATRGRAVLRGSERETGLGVPRRRTDRRVDRRARAGTGTHGGLEKRRRAVPQP